MHIRDAELADARRIAEIRAAGWRVAYSGILEPDVLADLDPLADAARWLATWGDGGRRRRVADLGGRTVGFSTTCPYRRSPDEDSSWPVGPRDGEIAALYVDPSAWSRGVGSALMADAIARLTEAGHTVARLWVLHGNSRAGRFYLAHEFVDEEPGGVVKMFVAREGARPAVEVRYSRLLA